MWFTDKVITSLRLYLVTLDTCTLIAFVSYYFDLDAGVDCPSTFKAPPVPNPVLLPDDCAL